MAEDAASVVKARLVGLCRTRGLDLASAPIHVITTPVLRLDRGRDQARLRATVRQIAPRLLVLDPFVSSSQGSTRTMPAKVTTPSAVPLPFFDPTSSPVAAPRTAVPQPLRTTDRQLAGFGQ
jgi:hypothetical protein